MSVHGDGSLGGASAGSCRGRLGEEGIPAGRTTPGWTWRRLRGVDGHTLNVGRGGKRMMRGRLRNGRAGRVQGEAAVGEAGGVVARGAGDDGATSWPADEVACGCAARYCGLGGPCGASCTCGCRPNSVLHLSSRALAGQHATCRALLNTCKTILLVGAKYWPENRCNPKLRLGSLRDDAAPKTPHHHCFRVVSRCGPTSICLTKSRKPFLFSTATHSGSLFLASRAKHISLQWDKRMLRDLQRA